MCDMRYASTKPVCQGKVYESTYRLNYTDNILKRDTKQIEWHKYIIKK